jgi:hypothetical protein
MRIFIVFLKVVTIGYHTFADSFLRDLVFNIINMIVLYFTDLTQVLIV